jgi:hypothetical protein
MIVKCESQRCKVAVYCPFKRKAYVRMSGNVVQMTFVLTNASLAAGVRAAVLKVAP